MQKVNIIYSFIPSISCDVLSFKKKYGRTTDVEKLFPTVPEYDTLRLYFEFALLSLYIAAVIYIFFLLMYSTYLLYY